VYVPNLMTTPSRRLPLPLCKATFVALLFLQCICAPLSKAQTTTASVVGRVLDPSGAVVTNAQISFRNLSTNQLYSVTSNERGEFRLDLLPAGTYQEKVTAQGYKTTIEDNLVFFVGQIATVNAALSVGSAEATVEVTAEVPSVNTTNAEIGDTITAQHITELPLVDRNPYTLLNITPGVQANENSIVFGYPEQRTIINGGSNGSSGTVNYYLDGGPNITGLRNTGNITPNPDALQEFRVQTNSYSAEYGHFPGGIINAITRSGTNQLHGSAFEFFRSQDFAARTYGSNGLPMTPLHRHQFGGAIGGPIKHDRLFFFGSYAGLRQTSANFVNGAVVPTAAERTGDFSADATTAYPVDLSGTTAALFACGGVTGKICSTKLDVAAMNIVNKYIPVANSGTNKWIGYLNTRMHTDEFLAKATYDMHGTQHINLLYFNTSGESLLPANSTSNLPWSNINYHWRQQNVILTHDKLLTPTMINQAWVTYTRNLAGRVGTPNVGLDDLGSSFTTQGVKSLPSITVTGYFTLGESVQGPKAGTNFYSVRDMVSWTHGRHSIRFGGELSLDKDVQSITQPNYGVFSFSASMTAGTVSKVKYAGNALASFLIGSPASVQQGSPVTGYTNSWSTAGFFQDDYRVLPRLTLNLGLRYDIQTPPTDPEDKETTYIYGRQSTVRPSAPKGQLFPGDYGIERGIIPVRWNHFSPRAGFAWDVFGNGRTSLRGGAGIFWGSISGNMWNQMENFVPYSLTFSFTNAGSITGATLANPYRNLSGGNPYPYTGGWPVAGAQIYAISPNFNATYAHQFNLSVQQQLKYNTSLQVAYVGSMGHGIPFSMDANYPVANSTASTTASNVLARRPNTSFGQVAMTDSSQRSSYHSLQTQIQKRVGKQFTISAFYIWSKTLSSADVQTQNTNAGAQNYNKMNAEKALSDYDMHHQFVGNLTWRSELYHGKNKLISNAANGWQVSMIGTIRTGTPYNLLNGSDANLDGSSSYDRPALVGDAFHATGIQSHTKWFNTSAFSYNTPTVGSPVDGNTPRNYIKLPDYHNVDISAMRNIKLWHDVNLQLRGDASNALNIVNFTTPGTNQRTVTSSLFGQLNATSANRLIQIGGKFIF